MTEDQIKMLRFIIRQEIQLAALDAQIDEKLTPSKAAGVPW